MLKIHSAYKPFLTEEDIETLEEANKCIARLKKQTMIRLPMTRRPDVENPQHFTKVYTSYIQTHLRRFLRLFSGLCLYWDNQQIFNATFIIKALFESAAQLCHLNKIIEKCLKNKDYDTAYKTIANHGSFGKTGLGKKLAVKHGFKNINIMDAIRDADKEYKGFAQEYDWFSEFTHPNCLGVGVTFSRINHAEKRVDFLETEEINSEYLAFFISASITILVFHDEWNKHQKHLKAIKKINWAPTKDLVEKLYPQEANEQKIRKILRKKKKN